MKDVKEIGTLFRYKNTLYETISWAQGTVIWIQPIRTRDYAKCECGLPFPEQYQRESHLLGAPNLQDGISEVYIAVTDLQPSDSDTKSRKAKAH